MIVCGQIYVVFCIVILCACCLHKFPFPHFIKVCIIILGGQDIELMIVGKQEKVLKVLGELNVPFISGFKISHSIFNILNNPALFRKQKPREFCIALVF